jgi:hypothetical protein
LHYFIILAAIILKLKNIGGLMSKSVVYLLHIASVISLGYYDGKLIFVDKSADATDSHTN